MIDQYMNSVLYHEHIRANQTVKLVLVSYERLCMLACYIISYFKKEKYV